MTHIATIERLNLCAGWQICAGIQIVGETKIDLRSQDHCEADVLYSNHNGTCGSIWEWTGQLRSTRIVARDITGGIYDDGRRGHRHGIVWLWLDAHTRPNRLDAAQAS